MRSQILNSFKFFGTKQISRFGSVLSKGHLKFPIGLATGLLFASSYKIMSNHFNTIAKNADQGAESGLPSDFKSPELDAFTDEKYKQALENKQDVIIVWNGGDHVNQALNEIKVLLFYLEDTRATQKRKIKLLVFEPKSQEEIEAFEKKYDVKTARDTVFLIKNKYSSGLKAFGLQAALYNFESIFEYLQKLKKVRAKNFERFSKFLQHLPSSSFLVLAYLPKDSPNFESLKNKFADLKSERAFGKAKLKNVEFLAVTDLEAAKKLGLNPEKEGQVFILSKSSKYNHRQRNVTVNETNFNVLPLGRDLSAQKDFLYAEMSLIFKNLFIFEFPNFYSFPSRYSLVLRVDRNKIAKREYNHYVQIFANLHKILREEEKDLFQEIKIMKSKSKMHEGNFKILVIDNEAREKYYEMFDEEAQLTDAQHRNAYQPRSFTYRFPDDGSFDEKDLLRFIQDVKDKKVPEYFESSKEPACQKYSTKIVKDNFKKEIVDVDKHHVLFFHSAHCHNCQKLKPKYEALALENIRDPDSNIQFNRMDSDLNVVPEFKSFHYTPVFMVMRKEEKLKPFVYSSQFFNPEMLRGFINATVSQELIHSEVEKKIWKDCDEKRKLFEGLKIEEVQ